MLFEIETGLSEQEIAEKLGVAKVTRLGADCEALADRAKFADVLGLPDLEDRVDELTENSICDRDEYEDLDYSELSERVAEAVESIPAKDKTAILLAALENVIGHFNEDSDWDENTFDAMLMNEANEELENYLDEHNLI